MGTQWFAIWPLVIVAAVLAGWWLTIRPRSSYRGVAGPVSFLIVVAAILMCILALTTPRGPGHPTLPTAHAVTLSR